MYPNVKNIHLKTSLDITSATHFQQQNQNSADETQLINNNSNVELPNIKFLHEVANGPCDMQSGYGIIMAEVCAFPIEVIQDARQLRKVVRDNFPLLLPYKNPEIDTSVNAVTNLLQHLLLLKNSTLDDSGLKQYLNNLRKKISKEATANILQFINLNSDDTSSFEAISYVDKIKINKASNFNKNLSENTTTVLNEINKGFQKSIEEQSMLNKTESTTNQQEVIVLNNKYEEETKNDTTTVVKNLNSSLNEMEHEEAVENKNNNGENKTVIKVVDSSLTSISEIKFSKSTNSSSSETNEKAMKSQNLKKFPLNIQWFTPKKRSKQT
jgi:hypothetical protein